MNQERRARLKHTLDALEAALDELECLQEEEEEALDNIPENLRESERASQMDYDIEEIYIGLVWPIRLIYLAMGEVLCDGFNLAVLNPSDRKGHDTYFYYFH